MFRLQDFTTKKDTETLRSGRIIRHKLDSDTSYDKEVFYDFRTSVSFHFQILVLFPVFLAASGLSLPHCMQMKQ